MTDGRPRREEVSRLGCFVLGVLLGTACALVLLGTGFALGPSHSRSPALGRLADGSPHLLLDGAGWELRSAKRYGPDEGAIEFAYDDLSRRGFLAGRLWIETQTVARLRWHSAEAGDLAPPARSHGTAPVLGVAARLYSSALVAPVPDLVSRPGREYLAAWEMQGHRFELSAPAPDRAAFVRLLGQLRTVTRSVWVNALPAYVELVGTDPVAGIPVSDWLVGLSCADPLAPPAARAQPRALAYFKRECAAPRADART